MIPFLPIINWVAIGAIATALAAIITAFMAYYTKRSIVQADRQHRNNMRPILVLAPPGGAETKDRASLLEFKTESGKHKLLLSCELKNIGVGPAINPKMHLRVMGIQGYGFTQYFSPVQAGDVLWKIHDASAITFEASPTSSYNDTDHNLASCTLWELVLEYDDVFGEHFHTIHSKDATRPWTICGTGFAPTKNVSGKQTDGSDFESAD